MSDHDPNGDDDFLKPPVRVESKPNSSRYALHKTSMFPAFIPNAPGNTHTGVAPTVEMEEIQPPAPVEIKVKDTPTLGQVLNVRTVVSQLIERNLTAWKALPAMVRDTMLSTPELFRIWHQSLTGVDSMPHIIYNGVVLKYTGDSSKQWVLDGITNQ
jgi:hypothetical protein